MKSIRSLASFGSLLVVGSIAACSSSNSGSDGKGTGGSTSTGGTASDDGGAGKATGGAAGKGSGGTAGNANGGSGGGSTGGTTTSSDAGGIDGGDASTQPGGDSGASGSGGANTDGSTGSCQADVQNDPQNCGRCGKSCGGGDCSQGSCEPVLVLDAQEEPYRPGLDGYSTFLDQGKVYEWEYTTTNAVHYIVQSTSTAPASPASKGDLVQDVPSTPNIDAVTFDGTYAYEAIEEAAGVKGEVSRKKLDRSENTGAATKLFSLPADLKWDNIAVASDAIYLTGTTELNGASHPAPDTTAFYRMALPVANAAALPAAIPNLGSRQDFITDLTVIGSHLFWLESYGLVDFSLTTAPVTGGSPVELDPDILASTSSIATDGTYVYWTTINDLGELKRCPLVNLDAAHVTHVADVSSAQEGIIVKGQYVYTMELVDRAVFRVNKDTGDKELLGNMAVAPSFLGARVVGLDAGFLYMTTQDAKIWRLPSAP